MNEQKERLVACAKTKEWQPLVERDICPFIASLFFRGYKSEVYSEALGVAVPSFAHASINGYIFMSKEAGAQTTDAIHTLASRDDREGIRRIGEECRSRAEKLHAFLESTDPDDVPGNLAKLSTLYPRFSCFIHIILFPERYLHERIEELIIEKTGESNQRYFEALIYVCEDSNMHKELRALLELASEVQRAGQHVNDPSVQERVRQHAEQYGWLATRWYLEAPWGTEDITKRLRMYVEEKDPEQELQNLIAPHERAEEITREFITKYDLNEREIALIDLVKEFVFLRTFRTEGLARAAALMQPLLKAAAKRAGVPFRDIVYLTIDEVLALCDGEWVDHDRKIKERKRGHYTITCNNESAVFSGAECDAIDALGLFTRTVEEAQELTGNIAWKGTVRGSAKIVKSEQDLGKVEKGDILVAVMTFPHFVSAMERAAAFVTDEGGILCHAAIVAREMHKPCIIGTKCATAILTDGDLVEVDADNGIVKIVDNN